MKKEYLKKIRIIATVNFVAELINIISLYFSDTQSVKIWNINILSFFAILFNIASIVYTMMFIKKVNIKDKNYKKLFYILLISLSIEFLIIILNIILKLQNIIPYLQVICDMFRILFMFYIYKKNIKLVKKEKFTLILILFYIISKISYIMINQFNNITIVSIFSTISIISVVVTYVLYINFIGKTIKGR